MGRKKHLKKIQCPSAIKTLLANKGTGRTEGINENLLLSFLKMKYLLLPYPTNPDEDKDISSHPFLLGVLITPIKVLQLN